LIDLLATDKQSVPPIPSSKKEKPQLVLICNQGEFFVKPKEVEHGIVLEGVSPTVKVPEEIDKLPDEDKGVGHDNLLDVLPPMEDNRHLGTFIFYNFKDPFLQEENARDESFQFFKFISPTIGTWTRRKHDPSLSCMDYDENL